MTQGESQDGRAADSIRDPIREAARRELAEARRRLALDPDGIHADAPFTPPRSGPPSPPPAQNELSPRPLAPRHLPRRTLPTTPTTAPRGTAGPQGARRRATATRGGPRNGRRPTRGSSAGSTALPGTASQFPAGAGRA